VLEFLPNEVREALANARRRRERRGRRLSLHLGDAVFPVLRMWDDGFAIDASRLPRLRGFVELHDGPRLLFHCLIVAHHVEQGELICSFKRATPPADSAPADFERHEPPPAGLLPRPL
jgi:hypothetical protein